MRRVLISFVGIGRPFFRRLVSGGFSFPEILIDLTFRINFSLNPIILDKDRARRSDLLDLVGG